MNTSGSKFVFLFIAASIGTAATLMLVFYARQETEQNADKEYSRIISLAPSTTEILYALGLQDKVIGVSQYCSYPPEVEQKPRFGGLMNVNYEAILAAEPDTVVVFEEMCEPENKFEMLGIDTVVVGHDSIEDIIESILLIGKKFGAEQKAAALAEDLQKRIAAIAQASENKDVKVMICVGHSIKPGADEKLENIVIAGQDGFYSRILEIIGAENAYTGSSAFPQTGYESLVAMNPDVIIDTTSANISRGVSDEVFLAQWNNFTDTEAVKTGRVYVINDKFMAIPGPRFIRTIEKIAQAVNDGAKTID